MTKDHHVVLKHQNAVDAITLDEALIDQFVTDVIEDIVVAVIVRYDEIVIGDS